MLHPALLGNGTQAAYLYTAYWDLRKGNMGPPAVRVLLLARRTPLLPITPMACIFPDDTIVVGNLYEMNENHNRIYGAYFLSCAIPFQYLSQIPLPLITVIQVNSDYKFHLPISKVSMYSFNKVFVLQKSNFDSKV